MKTNRGEISCKKARRKCVRELTAAELYLLVEHARNIQKNEEKCRSDLTHVVDRRITYTAQLTLPPENTTVQISASKTSAYKKAPVQNDLEPSHHLDFDRQPGIYTLKCTVHIRERTYRGYYPEETIGFLETPTNESSPKLSIDEVVLLQDSYSQLQNRYHAENFARDLYASKSMAIQEVRTALKQLRKQDSAKRRPTP
jgi:hypothetical protein